MMDVDEVGRWRFCPACAKPLAEPEFDSENPDAPGFQWEDPRCSGCHRPWTACPCENIDARKAEPFIVKHYIDDDRPSIKGNGFDGLTLGEDGQEAQEFVDWPNARLLVTPNV